jgi:hypothetical protein
VLGVIYGIFMGLYAVLRSTNPSYLQMFATALKVPLLFLLTMGVTYPSLYTISALAQSPLRARELANLLLASLAVNLAVLASFAPITGFFTLCTESYPFMVVLNVLLFLVAGLLGLSFLQRSLAQQYKQSADASPDPLPASPQEAASPEAPGQPTPPSVSAPRPSRNSGQGQDVFRGFLIIYGVVGAQMGWVLRPFIGAPEVPFEWFRPRDSHFFAAFWEALRQILQ